MYVDGITWNVSTHLPLYRIYASVNWVRIRSGNGLSPIRRQVIICINAGSLCIGPLGTNFNENLIKNTKLFIHENAYENIVCEMAILPRGR